MELSPLVKQQINSAITSLTGMMPDGTLPPGAQPGDGTGPGPLGQPGVITPFEEQTLAQMQSEILLLKPMELSYHNGDLKDRPIGRIRNKLSLGRQFQ
jgi:hypothetical protein